MGTQKDGTPLTKAVILAAGRGTRMQALTDEMPKPMLPLAGRPMLEHILERLKAAEFTSALLVTGYHAEVIERHFAHFPMELHFVRQEPLDGTAHAALLARDFAGSDDFLLTYGDILIEPHDYLGLCSALSPESEAVVGVKEVEDPWAGAAVYETSGIVTAIIEKPPPGGSSTRWNSAGIYVFRPSVFPQLAMVPLSPRGEYELTSAIHLMIQAGKQLRIYPVLGTWRDVGRPEDLEFANRTLGPKEGTSPPRKRSDPSSA